MAIEAASAASSAASVPSGPDPAASAGGGGASSQNTNIMDSYVAKARDAVDMDDFMGSLVKMVSENTKSGFGNDLKIDMSLLSEMGGMDLEGLMNLEFLDGLTDMLDQFSDIANLEKMLNDLIGGDIASMLGDKFDSIMDKLPGGIGDKLKKFMDEELIGKLKDLIQNSILNRLKIPEVVYLSTIVGLYSTGGDINAKEEYVKYSVALPRDMALVLKWINKVNGEKYNPDSISYKKDLQAASSNGSFKSVEFIFRSLQKSINKLKHSTAAYEQRKEEFLKSIEEENDFNVVEILTRDYNEFRMENEPIYYMMKKQMEAMRLEMVKHAKKVLVNSYGNLNVPLYIGILKRYDIHPCYFGDNDTDYVKMFKITSVDIDKMAPKTEDGRYIELHNVNMKHIFVALTSKKLFPNGTHLEHKALYRRLKMPLRQIWEDLLDSLGFDIDLSLDKLAMSIYNYTKKMEKHLEDFRKVDYINIQPDPFNTLGDSVLNYLSGKVEDEVEGVNRIIDNNIRLFSPDIMIDEKGTMIRLIPIYKGHSGETIPKENVMFQEGLPHDKITGEWITDISHDIQDMNGNSIIANFIDEVTNENILVENIEDRNGVYINKLTNNKAIVEDIEKKAISVNDLVMKKDIDVDDPKMNAIISFVLKGADLNELEDKYNDGDFSNDWVRGF